LLLIRSEMAAPSNDGKATIPIGIITLVAVVLMIAFCATGCAAIAGIFKAGVWVGVVGAVLLVGLAAIAAGLLSR